MAKTTVFLVRHGDIENPKKILYGRSLDFPLSKLGQEQIKQLAIKIKNKDDYVDKIYSSPLKRSIQTSQIISNFFNLKLPIVRDDRLTDVDIPALVGQPLTIIDEIHGKGIDEYEEEYVRKGHETRENVVKRMTVVLNEILEKNTSRTIAIVSHGHPLLLLYYKRMHPYQRIIPKVGTVQSLIYYVRKGEAIKLVFDSDNSIVKNEPIKNNYENRN